MIAVDGPGVYLIRCTANGKVYIGCSSVSVMSRKSGHFSSLRKGVHLSKRMQADFDLYGEQAFQFEVLQLISDGSQLEVEQSLIALHDSADPRKGYNIAGTTSDGRRVGFGRPAPLGRKVVASVRLTPEVNQCLREQPDGLVTLEIVFRESDLFKDWLKNKKNKGN